MYNTPDKKVMMNKEKWKNFYKIQPKKKGDVDDIGKRVDEVEYNVISDKE